MARDEARPRFLAKNREEVERAIQVALSVKDAGHCHTNVLNRILKWQSPNACAASGIYFDQPCKKPCRCWAERGRMLHG